MSYQYKDRIVVKERQQDGEEVMQENRRNIKRRLTREDRDRLLTSEHVSNRVKVLAI